MGHSVVVASNGQQALLVLATQPFDLVLMDVQMPEMDGLTAARKIRESEQSTPFHLPIIAMTAHAMKGDRERCIAAGMDGYVSKPISVPLLEEEIASVMGKDKEAQTVGSTNSLQGDVAPTDMQTVTGGSDTRLSNLKNQRSTTRPL
jgi:CheY-like chemotaxis protein